MCRNIKTLYNFDPPATNEEIYNASLQFVRKITGFKNPSKVNEQIFEKAIEEITTISNTLLTSLQIKSPAKNRELEAKKRRTKSAGRFNN